MAKANETSLLQGLFNKMLAKSTPSDIKDMLVEAQMSKAFDIIEAGAESLSSNEFVPDQFAMGNTESVATAAEVVTGPNEAATGANAEKQIAHYSPNQVPQHGLTLRGTQIGELVASGRMDAMEKSIAAMNQHMRILSAGLVQVLEKSIAAPAAAAVAKPAAVAKSEESAGEMREKEKEKDDDEDEKAKSRLVDKATAEFATAKSLVTAAEELEGDGRAGTAKSRRTEAQTALSKAETLLGAASALGASGATVDALGASIVTFAKAKAMSCNQDKYPDSSKGEEAAKSATPATPDAVIEAQNAVLAKAAEIQAALQGLALLKTDVNGVMAAISGKSLVPGGVPNTGALAKSDPSAYARVISSKVMEMQDEGLMSDGDVMAVNDILGKMQGAAVGVVPEAVVQSRIAAASGAVRSLFAEAA